jgi:hypothetical protein
MKLILFVIQVRPSLSHSQGRSSPSIPSAPEPKWKHLRGLEAPALDVKTLDQLFNGESVETADRLRLTQSITRSIISSGSLTPTTTIPPRHSSLDLPRSQVPFTTVTRTRMHGNHQQKV